MWIVLLVVALIALVGSIALGSASRPQSGGWKRNAREERSGLMIAAVFFGFISLGCGIGFMWTTRPWWHWLWFNCFYMVPTIWIIVGAFGVLAAVLGVMKRFRWMTAFILTGCILLFIVVPVLAQPMTMVKVYREISQQAVFIEELPKVSEIRYMPMDVASEYYGKAQMATSTRTCGDFDPIFDEDGKIVWAAPLVPSGGIRSMSKQMEGIAVVKNNGDLELTETPFKYGEGMIVVDNVLWKLREHRYLVEYADMYCVKNGDSAVIVAPYIKYRFSFPVMIPYFGGVCVVYPDGKIEDYTPEEARNVPFLKGQPLLPEKLARIYVESWAYKYGIKNEFWMHEDQIMIPEINYSENQMPYLMPIGESNKPTWVITTEPAGEAFGLSKIFFVDARKPEMEIYEVVKWDENNKKYVINQKLIGPNQAWGIAKGIREVDEYKWLEAEGTWRLIEPRPAFSASGLYWMLSVTPQGYEGIQYTLLVAAENPKENRYAFETEEEVKDFLLTGKVQTAPAEIAEPAEPAGSVEGDEAQQIENIERLLRELQKAFEEYKKIKEAK